MTILIFERVKDAGVEYLKTSLSEEGWESIYNNLTSHRYEYENIKVQIKHDFYLLKAIFIKEYNKTRKDTKNRWNRDLEIYLCKAVDNMSFSDLSYKFNLSISTVNSIYNKARRLIISCTKWNNDILYFGFYNGKCHLDIEDWKGYIKIYNDYFNIDFESFKSMYNIPLIISKNFSEKDQELFNQFMVGFSTPNCKFNDLPEYNDNIYASYKETPVDAICIEDKGDKK